VQVLKFDIVMTFLAELLPEEAK